MKKRLKYYGFILLITPICFELALRILGYSPYKHLPYTIDSRPGFCIVKSSTLGFSLGEGSFDVHINKGLVYSCTHRDGKRITQNNPQNDSLDRVFIMGCSYTYGMGVSDSSSFPYLVQNHFSTKNIENFGVPGYGTVQSYFQLKSEIESGTIPSVVVVNFCDFHHERNSLTPRYRMSLEMGYQRSNPSVPKELLTSKFPYVEGKTFKLEPYHKLYSIWSGRETFATINYFQTMKDERLSSAMDLEKNSQFVFSKIHELCKKHKIQLVVTGLTRSKETKSFLNSLSKMGIQTRDISIDLSLMKYNKLPYDSHPSELAHAHYAKKVIAILEEISSRQPSN